MQFKLSIAVLIFMLFLYNIKSIMSLKYFHRIKQFMIRLYRNNIFFGNKGSGKNLVNTGICYACSGHPELRKELLSVEKLTTF